ncbi:hypothetical protein TCAL_10290 [Tigriopus californicus]|uniref:Ephrin RBD domain-containing protein n=1 Tax=Tigriopus californicus TaxID=6832 RepID=A0A553NYK7_TIGCA|nr:ephrin-B1-like [Tigriopus californicus]TRY70516.1 hypothetical protein TCAL_10290 [Tigriopus californicus]|eukprot:TCALIF_10290-PA protein Name:"Similar to EFNB1 Ephrin-B1 (Gallus gallus)" AED:0.17 eAED:0.18 QI:0/-1/0/1/-1/1/1/0/356
MVSLFQDFKESRTERKAIPTPRHDNNKSIPIIMNTSMCMLWAMATSLMMLVHPASTSKVHYLHWNHASPMFRIDNTEHIVDVEEFDQVNIICPVSKPGIDPLPEQHVIYSVSRDEFDKCRITNPKPKIVAICNQPYRLMYFTITFRSFTPTPGGLEFHPGQDYYFISTSNGHDLHRRVGGGCATHNMRMMFKMKPSPEPEVVLAPAEDDSNVEETTEVSPEFQSHLNSITDGTTEKVPRYYFKTVRMPDAEPRDVFYYHPKDVTKQMMRKKSSTMANREKMPPHPAANEVLKRKSFDFKSSDNSEDSSFQRHRLLGSWSPFISVTTTSGVAGLHETSTSILAAMTLLPTLALLRLF